jgi:hypothetical protein
MMNLGLKALLLLLAIVLFIVGALSDDFKKDLLFWGLAIFAASFIVESLPLGTMTGTRTRER